MDPVMLVLMNSMQGNCLAATVKQFLFHWESGVGMASLALFEAGTSPSCDQRNPPSANR